MLLKISSPTCGRHLSKIRHLVDKDGGIRAHYGDIKSSLVGIVDDDLLISIIISTNNAHPTPAATVYT